MGNAAAAVADWVEVFREVALEYTAQTCVIPSDSMNENSARHAGANPADPEAPKAPFLLRLWHALLLKLFVTGYVVAVLLLPMTLPHPKSGWPQFAALALYVLVAWAVVPAILCPCIARLRGGAQAGLKGWMYLGLFFGPIGLYLSLHVRKPRTPQNGDLPDRS